MDASKWTADYTASQMMDGLAAVRRAPLFRNVPTELVDATLARGLTRHLTTGESLLSVGQPNSELHIIASGRLAVYLDGVATPHLTMGPGECVGELSIIDASIASANVIAVEPTETVAVARDAVLTLIDQSAEAARNLLRVLTSRLRHDGVALVEADRLRVELEDTAHIDTLTGLGNRRWMETAFDRQLTRSFQSGESVALLVLDLDDFKRVNDSQGHLAGDAVLRRVGHAIPRAVRPHDLVARYAGDEFVALLPGADGHQARTVAERLREGVTSSADASAPAITVSVGIATASQPITLPQLVAAADAALYRAKREGRNRVSD